MSDAGRKIIKALDKVRDAFDAAFDFLSGYVIVWLPLMVLTAAGLLVGLIVHVNTPTAAITLDRAHWACTQSMREVAFVTKQGVPINHTACTQWSYQP